MTSEKREKAIKYLTEEIRSLRMAPEINGCGQENWAEQLEIMETCLEAVSGCILPKLAKCSRSPRSSCGRWTGSR